MEEANEIKYYVNQYKPSGDVASTSTGYDQLSTAKTQATKAFAQKRLYTVLMGSDGTYIFNVGPWPADQVTKGDSMEPRHAENLMAVLEAYRNPKVTIEKPIFKGSPRSQRRRKTHASMKPKFR